jgi:rhodanese-related sulfurtransferase
MSELAGLYLEAAGYAQVYSLEGGFRALRKT